MSPSPVRVAMRSRVPFGDNVNGAFSSRGTEGSNPPSSSGESLANLTFGADPIGAPVRCRSKDPPLLSGSLAIAWSAGDTANDRYPEQHGIAHPKRTVCGGEFGEPDSAAKRTQPNGSTLLKMTKPTLREELWRYPRLRLRRAPIAGAQARGSSDEGSAGAIRDLLSFFGYSALYPARWRERRR
jgi:hypothetical protein